MIDINNESGVQADELGLVALARFALSRLRIHPQADLSILLVDEATMAEYHQRFMDLPGPTDVMSFPMDELREPAEDEEPPLGLLGDIVLCPQVTARQAAENGREPAAEAEVGAATAKDMGKIMGILMPRVKGRADGKLVNEIVRSFLK